MHSYGNLIRVGLEDSVLVEAIKRVQLDASAEQGGVDEAALQDPLFRFPRTLPIGAINAALRRPPFQSAASYPHQLAILTRSS